MSTSVPKKPVAAAKNPETYLARLLHKAGKHFPQVDELLGAVLENKSTGTAGLNVFITAEMQVIINQIKNCTLNTPLKELYISSKKYELLLLLCNAAVYGERKHPIKLSDYDLECLQRAKELILENLDHPYTITRLAHKIAMNEFKLKKGFKQLYGTSVHELIRNERMKKSLSFLQESEMSIQQIALELGFPGIAAFTNAFRSKFGYPPSAARKMSSRSST